ncbi:hypothetical protein [uncultured Jatrophihabitans sp.]|uniref:hypothetical protein n=1 Tax=uncultured Jatrophihabitans sp. TaxID=1610747 RepID=UPI0035CAB4FA
MKTEFEKLRKACDDPQLNAEAAAERNAATGGGYQYGARQRALQAAPRSGAWSEIATICAPYIKSVDEILALRAAALNKVNTVTLAAVHPLTGDQPIRWTAEQLQTETFVTMGTEPGISGVRISKRQRRGREELHAADTLRASALVLMLANLKLAATKRELFQYTYSIAACIV